jgi:hypothetical protein
MRPKIIKVTKRLERFLVNTRKNSERGILMGVEVIQDALKICRWPGSEIHCVARRDRALIPSLSASLLNGELQVYSHQSRLEALVTGLEQRPQTVGNTHNFEVHFVGLPSKSAEELVKILCQICEQVRLASLVARNLREDYLSERIHALEDAMRKSRGTFTVADLCSFIKMYENVNVNPLSVPPKLHQVSLIPELNHRNNKLPLDESFRHVIEECRSTGRPYYGFRRHRNRPVFLILFPIKRGTEAGVRISSLLLVYDRKPLHFRVAYSVSELVFHYMAMRHTQGQIHTLTRTHRAADPLHTPVRLTGFAHLIRLLRKFARPLLSRALNNARAHSTCMRLFSIDDRSLHVFIDLETELGKRKKREKISDSYWEQSVVAFTFRMGKQLPYTYIPNTVAERLPKKYKRLGLRSILNVRENTRSEICFPIMCGDVCVGTLNFESPVPDGFHEDIAFLEAIQFAIESYFNQLIRANDVAWLIDRLDAHENVHELKSYVQSGVISGRAAELVTQLMIDPHSRSTDCQGLVTSDDVFAKIETWLRSNYDALDVKRIDSAWNCFKTETVRGIKLNREVAEVLFIIIKNLLKNLVSYGDEARDRIRVERKDGGLLRIRSSTCTHIAPDDLDALTIAPIVRTDGTVSYGMFLVGVLARILNGTTMLTRDGPRSVTHTDIILPLGNEL